MSEALAESRRLRRQMTADIAHDLRTPLSVILSHLDALDDGVLTDRGEATRIVREETERLSRLVEDLRLLTRADAGELALTTRPTDVGQLVSSVVQAYQPAARAKRIGLAAEVPPAIAPLDLDPDRMRQVLSNLLANAVFHTPTGGRVTLRAEESPEGVRLTMDDTGPGIDADQRERIFDRFYRGDPARRREDGGSGLGLAIARSIVEAHGGRIGVEDAPDGGSRFWLVVPRRGKGAHGGGSDG
jgi:signal transduction histidine kinase